MIINFHVHNLSLSESSASQSYEGATKKFVVLSLEIAIVKVIKAEPSGQKNIIIFSSTISVR